MDVTSLIVIIPIAVIAIMVSMTLRDMLRMGDNRFDDWCMPSDSVLRLTRRDGVLTIVGPDVMPTQIHTGVCEHCGARGETFYSYTRGERKELCGVCLYR